MTEGASGARLGTVIGWKTPAGREYGVVLGQEGKFLLCLTIYEKSLKKDPGLKLYRDETLTGKLAMHGLLPGLIADVQKVPASRATKQNRLMGKALQPFAKAAEALKLEGVMYRETTAMLEEIRKSLDLQADPLVEVELSVLDELTEEDLAEGGLRWVRKKFGAAAAAAHRNFVKMVRKNPAAHKRKMRADKIYRRRHKFHDRLMRRTARKGKRRVRSEDVAVQERDAGQSFMDLPFELRVTSEEENPDSMKVQTLIFSKKKFSRETAAKWAEDHGFKASKVDEKENTFRLRQRDPDEFETFRTISFKPGIKAVVAKA